MANCDVCGKPMVRFENPVRWMCPRTADHARIEREKRQHSGGSNKGNPQSHETLSKGKKKKK